MCTDGERMKEDITTINWWKPLVVFSLEVFVGSLIFILVLIPAVGLNYLVKFLADKGIDSMIISGLTALEYTIFAVDVALCLFFIVKSAIKAGKEL